ncbi:MAG: ABC transporter ATP-binding protein, partial [Phycisphaerae bacterium]|nr:ABC transporter ATP-binding protein [Phycisphaerae bacterium]
MTAALEIKNLAIRLPESRTGRLRTVINDVSLCLEQGESLGLVGSSGCGKTTCARAALRLLIPSAGSVHVNGTDLAALPRKSLRQFRRHMQMVFQDPGGSLNGRMRAGDLVAEPMVVHGLASGDEARSRAKDLMDQCGLVADSYDKWPHQFSGGQRQRICIARALASQPSLLVCDEPTSSLDVSVQATILTLLRRLRDQHGLAMLF